MRRIGSAVVATALLGACTGAPSASDVLSRAARSLSEIHSGKLHLSVIVETAPGSESSRVGFELDGPFAFGAPGDLPEARVTYTQIAGDDELQVTLTSTGDTAYQTVAGQTIEMSEPQLDALRDAGDAEGFEQLGVDDWITEAVLQDGRRRGDADVYLVTGRLNPVAALTGMVAAARAFGASSAAGLEHLGDADARAIDDAIGSSNVELYAGEEDGLLRELSLVLEFEAAADEEVLEVLGPLSGARLFVDLAIDDPNSPVDVDAPSGVTGRGSP